MKHNIARCNDEYQCSCGLTWDIKEKDPHQSKQCIKPIFGKGRLLPDACSRAATAEGDYCWQHSSVKSTGNKKLEAYDLIKAVAKGVAKPSDCIKFCRKWNVE